MGDKKDSEQVFTDSSDRRVYNVFDRRSREESRGRWTADDVKHVLMLTTSLCIVVVFAVILSKAGLIVALLQKFVKALAPMIIGFIIAFLLNPIMNGFTKVFRKIFKNKIIVGTVTEIGYSESETTKKFRKIVSTLSVICTMICFVAMLVTFFIVLIPELKNSVYKLYEKFPGYVMSIQEWIDKTLNDNAEIEAIANNYLANFQTSFTTLLTDKLLPNVDSIVSVISSGIVGGVKMLLNFVIGIIVAIYILGSKDTLGAQGKKIIYSIFDKKRGNKVLDAIDYAYSVFGGFINGKIIDSIIVGIIAAMFLIPIDMPYAVLISVIIGVTNVIPFFGPFIGAIPCAFLVLVEDPKMCLIFVIFVVILQQIDGNILGPLIIGDSTGLSGLWVLFAIIVGGDLFGIPGMILGVPVFACLYTLATIMLRDKLKERGLNNKTDNYKRLIRFDDKTGDPVYGEKVVGNGKKNKDNTFIKKIIDKIKNSSDKNQEKK